MPVRFVITTLKPGVNPEDYESWVRGYDYDFVSKFPNYKSYKVHQITGQITSPTEQSWSYIERIEVESFEQLDKDLASEAGVEMRRQLYGNYLDRSKNIVFDANTID
jgi:hypothetical protein